MELVDGRPRFRVIEGGLASVAAPAMARPVSGPSGQAAGPVLRGELARIADLLVHLKDLRAEIARERDFWRGLEDSVGGLVEPPKRSWWPRISG